MSRDHNSCSSRYLIEVGEYCLLKIGLEKAKEEINKTLVSTFSAFMNLYISGEN